MRETVELQSGHAWAEYPDRGGSIFAIALPLRREPAAPETRRALKKQLETENTAGR